jgi:FlaG/FlaF family flagellin (archaellin)
MASRAIALLVAVALCLVGAATVFAGPKTKRVSVVVDATSAQIVKGSKLKQLRVTAQLDSSFARCERQRSVLLYRSVNGGLSGPVIGKATSQGGGAKGSVTITGISSTKIKPTDEFLAIAAQRKVKIKGKAYVCKRGVSPAFSANSV